MSIPLSIVVPFYEKQGAWQKTQGELTLQLQSEDEVIIVDDWSPGGCESNHPQIRVERPKRTAYTYRLCTLRNLGLTKAKHDAVLMLDPDCIPTSKLLSEARRIFDPAVLYGGRIDWYDVKGNLDPDPRLKKVWHLGWMIWGGIMLFSKTRTKLVGWFDTGFNGRWGAEDNDFANKCFHSGMELHYHTGLHVKHQFHKRVFKGYKENQRRARNKLRNYQTRFSDYSVYRPRQAVIVSSKLASEQLRETLFGLARLTSPIKIYLWNQGGLTGINERLFDQWNRKWACTTIKGSLEQVTEQIRFQGYSNISFIGVGEKKTVSLKPKSIQRKGKIKVLYVISTSRIGGAETVLKRLLREIDKRLYEVDVLVTHEKGGLDKEYRKHAGKVTYGSPSTILSEVYNGNYGYVHFINLFKYYHVIPQIMKAKPDTRIIASILANLHRSQKIWGVHIQKIHEIKPLLWAFTTDAYVNRKLFPDIQVVPNGVPTNVFSPASKDSKLVLWVGRIEAQKKALLIPRIARNLPGFKFVMIGGEKTEYYSKLVKLKTSNLTFLTGLNEKQVADYMSKASYFLFTSTIESLPVTVLEALSSECCVIAEKRGDIQRVIQHGVTGYLIPENTDSVKWITDKIKSLDVQVGKTARLKILASYNLDLMVKRYEFLYGLIGNHTAQTRIAFLWGLTFTEGDSFWYTKVDSMQQAINQLGINNVVQMFVPTRGKPRREIINSQSIYFYRYNRVKDLMLILRNFQPDMIFLNMFHDKKWTQILEEFPDTWISIYHYGAAKLEVKGKRKPDLFIVQQDYMRKKVAEANKIPLSRVKTCSFGIEQWLFKPVETEKKYTGVMVADFRNMIKRQHLLIQAWVNIPGKLLLIGRFKRSLPKNYHLKLQHLVHRLGLKDRVVFLDGYPHYSLPGLLSQAKIGFLTSSREAGSRALLEMMACGLPVIVTSDCEGNVNMVRDGVDGFIANPSPESIAEKTNLLLTKYQSLGKKASDQVRLHYPYHRMTGFYRSLVEEQRFEVSIITTSFNRGKYIEENIKSILNQTVKAKINHIIMDGGSTDNTLQVLEKYKGKVHAYVGKDSGQTDALVKAMDIIEQDFPQTRYVGWINADDYYYPHWLKDSLDGLTNSSDDVALVCSECQCVGISSHVIHSLTDSFITLKHFSKGNRICQPTVLIKMKAFKELKKKTGHYFHPGWHYVQDMELWTRFLRNGFRIKHLSVGSRGFNITTVLRLHPLQMSRTHRTQQEEERDGLVKEVCRLTGSPLPRFVKNR